MSDAKHTALPWRMSDISHGPSRIIECPKKHLLCQTLGENDEANAEFIVRACNSYDNLLEACQELIFHLPCMPDDHEGHRLLRKAQAAIAKATGVQAEGATDLP